MAERLEFKGDYMGFTYNGVHSSELGIVRVSDGSRFNENLLPTIQDKTVQVPGGNGTYYFGSYYTQKQFNISIAFDSLTEEQLNRLKNLFGDKKIHDLIFDEVPYKIYSAKVTGTATIKYIPFAEGATNRVYKGEGTIQFTCYNPFARCAFSRSEIANELFTKENLRETYPNIDEWWESAGFSKEINFGDIAVPFTMDISGEGSLELEDETILAWKLPMGRVARLNTKTGIAKDINDDIFNEYIDGDLTTKIPVGVNVPDNVEFTCLYF